MKNAKKNPAFLQDFSVCIVVFGHLFQTAAV